MSESRGPAWTVQLGQVVFRVWDPERYVETVFPDGAVCAAHVQATDSYSAHAHELGYGQDVGRMQLEHELLHTLLAQDAGEPWSPTLRGVATGQHHPGWREEEARVEAFQRVLNRLRRAAGGALAAER